MAFALEVRPVLRPYEGVILIHPDASEDEQKALFKRNKSIIEDQFGGSVKTLDTWGRRSLSNPIAKLRKAVYFHTTFEANPQAIAELERTMRINDHVLRFMHSRLEDGTDLSTYMDSFKQALADSATREREREAKFQARRAAQGSRGPRRDEGGPGGGREDRGGRGRPMEDMGDDEI
jgi:small subunit ribosomal protein S6